MRASFLFFALGFLAGCAEKESARFRLTGTVTFDGKPVPFGDVLFTPDGSKGNSGPQGIAHIRDGKYDTGALDGKGVGGGPTVVRVTGLTGPNGKLICEFEMPADLPKGEGKHDIVVPKGGAKGQKGPDI